MADNICSGSVCHEEVVSKIWASNFINFCRRAGRTSWKVLHSAKTREMDENDDGSLPQDKNEELFCGNSSMDVSPLGPEETIGHSTKMWVRLQSSLAYETSYVSTGKRVKSLGWPGRAFLVQNLSTGLFFVGIFFIPNSISFIILGLFIFSISSSVIK